MTDKKPMPELLPCPFCGGESNFGFTWSRDEGIKSYHVNCSVCSCRKEGFPSKESVQIAWNARAENTSGAQSELEQKNLKPTIDDPDFLKKMGYSGKVTTLIGWRNLKQEAAPDTFIMLDSDEWDAPKFGIKTDVGNFNIIDGYGEWVTPVYQPTRWHPLIKRNEVIEFKALAAPDHTELLREALEAFKKIHEIYEKAADDDFGGRDYAENWDIWKIANAAITKLTAALKPREGYIGLHEYEPDDKYPQFCKHCGYAPHEPLQHCKITSDKDKP